MLLQRFPDVLDHYRQPRNRGALEAPTCSADGANPLCGDQVRVDPARKVVELLRRAG